MHRILAVMLVFSVPAVEAAIYRCESGGRVTFTDRPCHAGAAPAELGRATEYQAEEAPGDLAAAWQRRLEAARAARDRADAEWLKAHRTRREREERIRAGLLSHEVVAGMNAAQVRQVLGEPERITRQDKGGVVKETWIYREGRGSRTVNFKDGEVTSASRRSGEKKGKKKR